MTKRLAISHPVYMTCLLSVLSLSLLDHSVNAQTNATDEAGWHSLFNGTDLSGWTVQCKPGDQGKTFWQVDAGTILCDSLGRRDHDYIWLVSDKEYGDFELRLKFQAYTNSPGNSGIQFRSRYDKDDQGGWLNGPQVDIHPPASQSWRTGLIYDETRGEQRWVSPSLPDSRIGAAHKPAEHVFKTANEGDGWNDLVLIAHGNHIKTIVNGVVCTEWDGTGILDNAAHRAKNVGSRGHFALQLHTKDQLRIRFKDIMIRELDRSVALESVPIASTNLVVDKKKGLGAVEITGELKEWHKVTLTLDGPYAHELDNEPNPFTDYNMTVTFTHESGSPCYQVPGYFAADGNAGNSSAEAGTKWRAHLSPDKAGMWTYAVSFTRGKHAALDNNGAAVKSFNGISGSFPVSETDKTGRDFRAHGRLRYVGKHHLQFAGSKEYFLKAGPDAPETLLAYTDFDNTVAGKPDKSPLKTWASHVGDWKPGDPTWREGKGRGLIGALNYLAGKGVNAFSFLTYNAAGDGDNVWPFVQRNAKLHYDCSKLDQWGMVFDHATALGLYLHFKLQENEMDDTRLGAGRKEGPVPESLDGGKLGLERKLYCRELIARFGHALALNWNIGEENTQSSEEIRDMAKFLHDTDSYKHHIVLHTFPQQQDEVYKPLLGDKSLLTGLSLQNSWKAVHQQTLHWLRESATAGRPWVVANDEQNPAGLGVPPDPGYKGHDGIAKEKQTKGAKAEGNFLAKSYTLHDIRKLTLWGNLMAGGAGVEYYFGYALPENDLLAQDFRSRDKSWDYCRIALEFFCAEKIPFAEMTSANALIGNMKDDNAKFCFAKLGELYLVYLPNGGTTDLDLSSAKGTFTVKWFNPRVGGELVNGSVNKVAGGRSAALGNPPAEASEDWLVLIASEARSSCPSGTSVKDGWVTVVPSEFQGAINNPLKGFRDYKKDGYGLLKRQYIKWNDIEVSADDTVERIIAHTTKITQIKGKRFEELNIKLIPRVYLDWDGSPGKQYWPADLKAFDYDSPMFQERLSRLIAKLGQAWDNDPRIFAVQMGLIGHFGEHHHPAPTAEQRRLLVEAFQKAFKNKPVLVRHHDEEFMKVGFGIYYDTFANLSREPPGGPKDQFPWQATTMYGDHWKRALVEGEVEYNWQQQRESAKPEETFGRTPDETMKVKAYRRYMIDKIRQYHASYLGWISNYDTANGEVLAGAAELQKVFGYRFVMESARYPLVAEPGQTLMVKLAVRNTGSAPFYLDWPVAVGLLDPQTRKPVWSAPLSGVDIRTWLPGEDWDNAAFAYRRPALSHQDIGQATLPQETKPGVYILALAILDRQGGMVPSARFAIQNYFRGGWHPLGFIGLGEIPQSSVLKDMTFDSPAFDDSLCYKVPEHVLTVKPLSLPYVKAVKP